MDTSLIIQQAQTLEDAKMFSELLPEGDLGVGNLFQGTIFSSYGDKEEYGPKRKEMVDRAYKAARDMPDEAVDSLRSAEKRPIEQDEQAFFHGTVYGSIVGGFIYILSLLVKEGLEVWIMGIFLLVISSIVLALWLVMVGPIVTYFVDPQNEMDRGWHNMWQRINVFFSATLAFVVVQTGTQIFLSSWKDSGATPYEAVAYLLISLTVFYGTFNIIRRLPAAQRGRRALF